MSPFRRTAARMAALGLAAGLVASAQPALPAHAADPVAGALTSGDPLFPHQGNGGYDVAHYDVDLAWTPGVTLALSTIAATVTIDATTTGAPLSSYALDFEGANLTVSEVTVNGAPAAFTRVDGDGVEPPAPHKLVVTPATPVTGAFTTAVTYSGIPSAHLDTDGSSEGWNATSDGATFLAQPIGAMAGLPVNNTPHDKATYRFDLDIPTTITNLAGSGAAAAVSNGELLSRTSSGDGSRTTWAWEQREQMATSLILISIGKYDMIESSVELSDGRVIPEWSFIDSAQSTTNKTTFTNRRAQLSTFIQRLERLYGPYPGNSTGIVMDSVPSAINYALETQDRSFFPSVNSLNGSTMFHELAHQWYGDAVTPEVWNDIWINEGMGTWGPTWYSRVLATETPDPTAVETTYFNSWNNTASTSANWDTPPSGMTRTDQLYGYQTYTRGAQFYEALRTALGTTDFLAFVKLWQVRYDGGNGGAADFEALAEEVSGRDLTAFFADWIHESGKPAWPFKHDLEIASTGGQVEPGDTVTYTVTATNTGRVPMTPVIEVDLSDVLDDATLSAADVPEGAVLDGTTLTWTVPATPVTAGGNVARITVPVTVAADASDDTLDATVRATTLGSTCVACSAGATVDPQPVTPAPVPTIDGTPVVGTELTALTEGWPAGTSFAYQWLRDDLPIEGAVASTYVPVAGDIGSTLAVRVTGSRPGNLDTTRTSAPTAEVATGAQSATPVPTVSGTPMVDVELTGSPGTWDEGTTLTYQWSVGGEPVEGATGLTYTPDTSDVGAAITFTVTSVKPGFVTVTRTSEPTAPVAPGDQTSTPTPVVTGTAKVGATLRAYPGRWDEGTTLRLRWQRDGVTVSGADGSTYLLGARDLGSRITVVVTGTRPGYASTSATSDPTAPVARGTQTLTPVPVVRGTARVGATLIAYGGAHDPGATVRFAWYADGRRIAGATARTYAPTSARVGARITVVTSSTVPGYDRVDRTSAATAPVVR